METIFTDALDEIIDKLDHEHMVSFALIWHLAGAWLWIYFWFTQKVLQQFYTSVQRQGNWHHTGKEEALVKKKTLAETCWKKLEVCLYLW